MKVVENKEVEYYKWQDWTQPVLTSNNTATEAGNIITTASTYFNSNTQPYMIMTGKTSTTTDVGYWQLANKTTEEWLNIKFPYKLKISALSVVTRPNDNFNRTFSVYAGVGGKQIGSNITPTAGATRYTIISSGEYITDNIFIKVHAQSTMPYFGLQNLQITAKRAVKSNSSDYDFYRYELVYKLPKKVERKYYKYVENEFVQTVPTSSELGGSEIACTGGEAKIYNPNNTSYVGNRNVQNIYYVPDGLKASSVFVKYDSYAHSPSGYVECSHDGVTWVNRVTWSESSVNHTIQLNDTEFYKYHKVVGTGVSVGTHLTNWLYCIVYTGETIKTVETTKDDYNYYVDVPIFYAINQ